jgi:hypothetical protein
MFVIVQHYLYIVRQVVLYVISNQDQDRVKMDVKYGKDQM